MFRSEEGARSDVIELALLLPTWQAAALESAARCRGLTAGQMLRRLIGELVGPMPLPPSDTSAPSSLSV